VGHMRLPSAAVVIALVGTVGMVAACGKSEPTVLSDVTSALAKVGVCPDEPITTPTPYGQYARCGQNNDLQIDWFYDPSSEFKLYCNLDNANIVVGQHYMILHWGDPATAPAEDAGAIAAAIPGARVETLSNWKKQHCDQPGPAAP